MFTDIYNYVVSFFSDETFSYEPVIIKPENNSLVTEKEIKALIAEVEKDIKIDTETKILESRLSISTTF